MNQDQLDNVHTILRVCKETGAPDLAVQAILCAGRGESDFQTHDRNSLGCDGVFQCCPPPIGGAEAYDNRFDTEWVARRWLTLGFWSYGGGQLIATEHPDYSPGRIANMVEGAYANLDAGAAYYDQFQDEAQQLMDQYWNQATAGVPTENAPSPPAGLQAAGPYAYIADQVNAAANIENAWVYVHRAGLTAGRVVGSMRSLVEHTHHVDQKRRIGG